MITRTRLAKNKAGADKSRIAPTHCPRNSARHQLKAGQGFLAHYSTLHIYQILNSKVLEHHASSLETTIYSAYVLVPTRQLPFILVFQKQRKEIKGWVGGALLESKESTQTNCIRGTTTHWHKDTVSQRLKRQL